MAEEMRGTCRAVQEVDLLAGVVQLSRGGETEWSFLPDWTRVADKEVWLRRLHDTLNCVEQRVREYEAVLSPALSNEKEDCSLVEVIKRECRSKSDYCLCIKESAPVVLPGQVIFTEKPLAMVTANEIELFLEVFQPLALMTLSKVIDINTRERVASFLLPGQCFALLGKFLSLSSSTQEKILSLCCPVSDLDAGLMSSLYHIANLLSTPYVPLKSETILKILVISSSNVFGDEEISWLGWFRVGCRVNHSCLPNTVWALHYTASSPILLFSSLHSIYPGSELTHSYLERERWHSFHLRNNALCTARGFQCDCEECSIVKGSGPSHDRKRLFSCIFCDKCASIVVIEECFQCLACGNALGAGESDMLLHLEQKWVNLVEIITSGASYQQQHEYELLVQQVHEVFFEILRHAPAHWTMVEISDILQSHYSSILPQVRVRLCTPQEITKVYLKVLYLKYLRLNSLHQCYPKKNSIEMAAAEDFCQYIKELLNSIETLHLLYFQYAWELYSSRSLRKPTTNACREWESDTSTVLLWKYCMHIFCDNNMNSNNVSYDKDVVCNSSIVIQRIPNVLMLHLLLENVFKMLWT